MFLRRADPDAQMHAPRGGRFVSTIRRGVTACRKIRCRAVAGIRTAPGSSARFCGPVGIDRRRCLPMLRQNARRPRDHSRRLARRRGHVQRPACEVGARRHDEGDVVKPGGVRVVGLHLGPMRELDENDIADAEPRRVLSAFQHGQPDDVVIKTQGLVEIAHCDAHGANVQRRAGGKGRIRRIVGGVHSALIGVLLGHDKYAFAYLGTHENEAGVETLDAPYNNV